MKESREGQEAKDKHITELKEDCFKMQEQVQKALKIHQANTEMKAKNQLLKKEMERMTHEHKTEIENKRIKIDTLEKQVEQLKDDIRKRTEHNAQISAKQVTIEQANL